MSGLKSVIITLPKGLSKGTTVTGPVFASDLSRTVPKLNLTSILTDKIKMENLHIPQQIDHLDSDNVFLKTDGRFRGKKRRLDHLTWEEKLQRK